jgi:hypothetical protein
MGERKKAITICVPVYNEEESVEPLYNSVLHVIAEISVQVPLRRFIRPSYYSRFQSIPKHSVSSMCGDR